MSKLVTIKQALALRKLGFNEETSRYAYRFWIESEYRLQIDYRRTRNRESKSILAIPTVDEAIDWIRRKYNIVIYNTSAPFVDPRIKNSKILYGYRVKRCIPRAGWNFRLLIGSTKWSKDCYAMKRQAIWCAIRFIQKQKKHDSKQKR